jgi:hypothetical protein
MLCPHGHPLNRKPSFSIALLIPAGIYLFNSLISGEEWAPQQIKSVVVFGIVLALLSLVTATAITVVKLFQKPPPRIS